MIAVLLASTVIRSGQSRLGSPASPPEFEVAAIKITKGNAAGPGVRITPGRLNVENGTLRGLIAMACKVRDFQISTGPGWINSEHYEIDAKTDGNNGVDSMC